MAIAAGVLIVALASSAIFFVTVEVRKQNRIRRENQENR